MRGGKATRHRAERGAAPAALVRLHRCECGQAIYVVVVFFFLLAGLLFLILNSGEKLNHKVQMQSAADSVAATGAAWYARGLNVISMCNVADTQLLSLIVLLDTLQMVTPPAVECIDDLVQNIGSSKAGRDIPLDDRISDWLVVGNAGSEQEIIHQFDDIVQSVNWPEYLAYDNGVLWECVKLMDGFSHAMLEITPIAAQREAMDIAEDAHADFGFVTPLYPALPVRDGKWDDFENPMRNGRMPPPDDRQIIGGFAYVMGYRGYRNQIMGPWSFWREPFCATRPMGLFDISRFSVLFNLVSEMELNMMFGDPESQVSLKNWEMDYDKFKSLDPNSVTRTWWESVSFDARYPQNETQIPFPPPASGSWAIKRHEERPSPRTVPSRPVERPNGWYDAIRNPPPASSRPPMAGVTPIPSVPRVWNRATEPREGADPREAVWYGIVGRYTTHYPELGIHAPHPPSYPDGSQWPYEAKDYKIYFQVRLWRFNGAELAPDDNITRDHLPPQGGGPFAPIMFDRIGGDHTVANVDERFTFNGFAYRSGAVRNWTKRFVNPNPIEEMVAYAQARVYSRYSWDLFSQHWKVKLMRTDRWKDVLNELSKGVPSGGDPILAELTDENLLPVRKMLEAYDEDFVLEVTH